MDTYDRNILNHLQQDGRASNVELAEAVGLSPSPCLRRVRELERQGVIRQYAALLDPSAVGLGVSVLAEVRLERQTEALLDDFEACWVVLELFLLIVSH